MEPRRIGAAHDPPTRTILVVATALALGLGLLILGVCLFVQSDWINQETLVAVTAWSTLGGALATALAFVGAGIAALRVGDQIRQAERHHMDSLSPFIEFTDEPLGSIAQDASGGGNDRLAFVSVMIHNIGLGPAKNVRLKLWAIPRDTIQAADNALELFSAAGLDEGRPHYIGGKNSLGVNAQGELILERTAHLPHEQIQGTLGISVLALFSSSDLFGRELFMGLVERGVQRR